MSILSSSYSDVSMLMDTSQDFESSPGGMVRWVASQSANPALQALMREAERDKTTRPSTPVHEPTSWTYPLTSIPSARHASGHNATGAPYLLPLSRSNSSASSSSLVPPASEPSASRRTKPVSTAQRRPLASSTSSANQPPRHSARSRSSSHSRALPDPFVSEEEYAPRDDEPEALMFIELLKKTSRKVDENSKKKQQMIRADGKEKEREFSPSRNGRVRLNFNNSSARPLTKTTSASAVCLVNSSTKVPGKSLTPSMSAHKPEPRGRVLGEGPSLVAPGVNLLSGKSTPTLLPCYNLKCDLEPASAHWLPAGASDVSGTNHAAALKAGFLEPTLGDGDSAMQDASDLTETDTEWEKPISDVIPRADSTMCMESDDEGGDTGMDVSFFKQEPSPLVRVSEPKPKPRPPQPTRPPTQTQRTRSGLPPLGMRRAPPPPSSQYGSTQRSKGVTVPRFKPPLLANAGGTVNRSGSVTKPTTTTIPRPPPRGSATKMTVAKTAAQSTKDPDSSFDVSFDVDADALEEAMKVYD